MPNGLISDTVLLPGCATTKQQLLQRRSVGSNAERGFNSLHNTQFASFLQQHSNSGQLVPTVPHTEAAKPASKPCSAPTSTTPVHTHVELLPHVGTAAALSEQCSPLRSGTPATTAAGPPQQQASLGPVATGGSSPGGSASSACSTQQAALTDNVPMNAPSTCGLNSQSNTSLTGCLTSHQAASFTPSHHHQAVRMHQLPSMPSVLPSADASAKADQGLPTSNTMTAGTHSNPDQQPASCAQDLQQGGDNPQAQFHHNELLCAKLGDSTPQLPHSEEQRTEHVWGNSMVAPKAGCTTPVLQQLQSTPAPQHVTKHQQQQLQVFTPLTSKQVASTDGCQSMGVAHTPPATPPVAYPSSHMVTQQLSSDGFRSPADSEVQQGLKIKYRPQLSKWQHAMLTASSVCPQSSQSPGQGQQPMGNQALMQTHHIPHSRSLHMVKNPYPSVQMPPGMTYSADRPCSSAKRALTSVHSLPNDCFTHSYPVTMALQQYHRVQPHKHNFLASSHLKAGQKCVDMTTPCNPRLGGAHTVHAASQCLGTMDNITTASTSIKQQGSTHALQQYPADQQLQQQTPFQGWQHRLVHAQDPADQHSMLRSLPNQQQPQAASGVQEGTTHFTPTLLLQQHASTPLPTNYQHKHISQNPHHSRHITISRSSQLESSCILNTQHQHFAAMDSSTLVGSMTHMPARQVNNQVSKGAPLVDQMVKQHALTESKSDVGHLFSFTSLLNEDDETPDPPNNQSGVAPVISAKGHPQEDTTMHDKPGSQPQHEVSNGQATHNDNHPADHMAPTGSYILECQAGMPTSQLPTSPVQQQVMLDRCGSNMVVQQQQQFQQQQLHSDISTQGPATTPTAAGLAPAVVVHPGQSPPAQPASQQQLQPQQTPDAGTDPDTGGYVMPEWLSGGDDLVTWTAADLELTDDIGDIPTHLLRAGDVDGEDKQQQQQQQRMPLADVVVSAGVVAPLPQSTLAADPHIRVTTTNKTPVSAVELQRDQLQPAFQAAANTLQPGSQTAVFLALPVHSWHQRAMHQPQLLPPQHASTPPAAPLQLAVADWRCASHAPLRRLCAVRVMMLMCVNMPHMADAFFKRLPQFSQNLEQELYMSAISLAAYADFATLDKRIKLAACTLHGEPVAE
eukprot:jgi/Chrzof1/6419/Cz18g10010.t1